MRSLLPARLLPFLLCTPAFAQWPTFGDGDVLSRPAGGSGEGDIWLLDPVTLTSSIVLPELFSSYSEGAWMAFDPFRDGLLVYTSRFVTGPFNPSLLLVRADGLVTDLGLDGERISALAPVGDGRVYCTSDRELSLVDRFGGLQPVSDTNGQAFNVPVDHLHYHAPSNSLVGVARTGYPGTCTSFGEFGLHRYSLNAAGTALASTSSCSTYFVGAESIPVALDPLPGGDLLLTTNAGNATGADMFRLNPATLGISDFADPNTADKDGGIWSQVVGAAVVLDDGANAFLQYSEGGSGAGAELWSGLVPGDPNTGVSTTFEMIDIERQPGACPGAVTDFGAGLAGTGGLVPTIDAGACPRVGSSLPILFGDTVPGGVGLLLVSRFGGAVPLFGGTVYVLPPNTAAPTFLADGNGAAQLLLAVPNLPAFVGVSFFMQGGFADPGAIQGVSLTAALDIVLG